MEKEKLTNLKEGGRDKQERMCYFEARSWKTKWKLKEGLLEELKDCDRVGQ